MGKKLPKKIGYKRSNSNNAIKDKFPDYIGKFPECKDYKVEMNLEDR